MNALLVLTAALQHCGGPCEVPRGADPVAADRKFMLTAGKEKDHWRYLWNWIWTEDGVAKHRLEDTLSAQPCRDFGYRRMFVSPAGNGFLVTGNPYGKRFAKGDAAPLFVFCDPEGRRLVEINLEHVLAEKERKLGPCPNCDCADVLYVFDEDPKVSANGCFVELAAAETRRRVAFFLPLGIPALDREKFEATLAEAEWAALPPERRDRETKEIDSLVRSLDSDDPDVREKASAALVAKGFLARDAVRKARAEHIEWMLRPWAGKWDAMAIDLGLLGSLLSYPDENVASPIRARLQRLLPESTAELKPKALAEWIEQRRPKLRWNAERGRYEE